MNSRIRAMALVHHQKLEAKMSVSCECGYGDAEWFFEGGKDYVPLPGKRRSRCWSCKRLMELGEDVVPFHRFSHDENGDEVPLATKYMCETCGGLYWSITEIGYCIYLPSDMREDVKQAAEMERLGHEHQLRVMDTKSRRVRQVIDQLPPVPGPSSLDCTND